MTRYPIGIQNFPNLIRDGYVYVDKTDLIYELTHTFQSCFLSRPRRFGKSLLQSTIEAYFSGQRELFRGLAIDRLENDWAAHPVIHIDLNNGDYSSDENFRNSIGDILGDIESKFGMTAKYTLLGSRFHNLIENLYNATHQRVVVLIDEYDKPMLEVISDEKAQDEYRKILKPFYGTLKKAEAYIKFIFITGVTKFAKLSIFSDLNQLKDISLLPEYDTICGITPTECATYFAQGINDFAEKKGWTVEETMDKLKVHYDGYNFSEDLKGVLNPFSLLNSLHDKKILDYWFRSGTPTFLVDLLKKHHTPIASLSGIKADSETLSSVESIRTNPIPAIYQSGYLSIKGYDEETDYYTLDYPNEEVKRGLLRFLLPYYVDLRNTTSRDEINKFVVEVEEGEPEKFLRHMQSMLGQWNYDLILAREAHYQNVLYTIFALMKFQVSAETRISSGRIDLVVETSRFVYIMEFKYKGSAEEAIDQIHKNGYAVPYQCDPRTVFLMGINFDDNTRSIDPHWIIQRLH